MSQFFSPSIRVWEAFGHLGVDRNRWDSFASDWGNCLWELVSARINSMGGGFGDVCVCLACVAPVPVCGVGWPVCRNGQKSVA